jgi:hypothetical protein
MEVLRTKYRNELRTSFIKWKRNNYIYGKLGKGTRVQVKIGNYWECGDIVSCDQNDNYKVELDKYKSRSSKNKLDLVSDIESHRQYIKPMTRLIRSGVIIDWNDIEPQTEKQRRMDKWGTRVRASDF